MTDFDAKHPRGNPKNRGQFKGVEKSAPEAPLQPDELDLIMTRLNDGRNAFRALTPDARARVFAAIENPTWESWDEARGVLITPHDTLWQLTLRHTDYDVNAIPADPAEKAAAGIHPPTRQQIITALDKGALPLTGDVPVRLENGQNLLVPAKLREHFRGVTLDGNLVVAPPDLNDPVLGAAGDPSEWVDGEYLIALTRCCNATAKGVENGIACRSCYRKVDPALGGPVWADDLVRLAKT